MNSPLRSFDTEANFWHLNPQFKTASVFNTLYEDDTSLDHSVSSKLMWAIALFADYESIYHNVDLEDKEKIIQTDFMKSKSFTIKKYKDQIEAYISLTYSQARKSLESMKIKLKERDTFIEGKKYTDETWKMLDEMLENTDSLYKEYERLSKVVASESAAETLRGGGEQSLTDSGAI